MFEGLFRPSHLLIILFIVLLVFGPSKLPELGLALGKTIRDFKKAMGEPPDHPANPAATMNGAREQEKLPARDA